MRGGEPTSYIQMVEDLCGGRGAVIKFVVYVCGQEPAVRCTILMDGDKSVEGE
jgi:hypothetical protein